MARKNKTGKRRRQKRARARRPMPGSAVAPPGGWTSPITSDVVVKGGLRLSNVVLTDKCVFWTEGRPQEKGRVALCKSIISGFPSERTPEPAEASPAGVNVRTRVHEYGGAPYAVCGDQIVSSFADNSLNVFKNAPSDTKKSASATCVVPPTAKLRFADGTLTPTGDFIAVCEDHNGASKPEEVKNRIVRVKIAAGGKMDTLAQGHDFYLCPRLSPDGKRLAFVAYDHPNMPWDSTTLYEMDLSGENTKPRVIASGCSVNQPRYAPNGTLYWVDDSSGWWNIYCMRPSASRSGASCSGASKPYPVFPQKAEFAGPHWQFGRSDYDFIDADTIVTRFGGSLGVLSINSGKWNPIKTPFSNFGHIRCCSGKVAFIGSAFDRPAQVVVLEISSAKWTSIQSSLSVDLTSFEGFLSRPETIEFPTTGGKTAFGLYYPPTNKNYSISGEKPPLLVKIHGGPTSSAVASLNLRIQFWASRGFGVVDVNYGGSTGFGREFRNRLRSADEKQPGNWGIVDVQDCCNAALFLVKEGRAHPKRLAIAGGSAGGFTTLACLCFRDVFSVGASYYGVADLAALARDTHKFESRYLDRLVGQYPRDKAVYTARSPLSAVPKLNRPMILFQGLQDRVVPPNQARSMFRAVKDKGLPVALVEFKGEGHGFRNAENIKASLNGEYVFYCSVFGIEPATGTAKPNFVIENLDAWRKNQAAQT